MNKEKHYCSEHFTNIFTRLKKYYGTDEVTDDRKDYILGLVKEYGYLPYSHNKALAEITPAEALIGIEEKFIQNEIYKDGKFIFGRESISPVARAGYTDSSWLRKEQLNVKLVNLSALGNGNKNEQEPGKFKDWIRQLLIASCGNQDFGILGTVMYFVPFHPRDFGCAYLPKSKFISNNLLDCELEKELGLSLEDQVKVFLTFCQLAGHPTMYDVLPQTGRFSATVLSNPFTARWFDIPQLNNQIVDSMEEIASELKQEWDSNLVELVKAANIAIYNGESVYIPVEVAEIEVEFKELLRKKKILISENFTSKENQEKLHIRVKKVITDLLGFPGDKVLSESEICSKHNDIISKLIAEGLWSAPGGAWNSSGVPIYDGMSEDGGYPLFRHYDFEGKDVSLFANLGCQTPYYFVHLESGEYNRPVIDFWCDFLVDLQQEYNFDGFRVDHIDHIVDKVSVDKNNCPISYRAPEKVLKEANIRLRKKNSAFGLLAEYMLWDGFLKEYHQNMGFDCLWGADIVSQHLKDVSTILEDNGILSKYNTNLPDGHQTLSILKTYNNQDGEFREIDQYPGQMEEKGALFKWFKLKFLPSCHMAERPVMFIDGDESFTRTGIEKVIGSEISMVRNDNEEFFRQFNAINHFALNNIFTRFGISEIHYKDKSKSGLISWTIKKQPEFGDDQRLLIVANENPPRQIIRKEDENNSLYSEEEIYETIIDVKVGAPEGFVIVSEYILLEGKVEFEEAPVIKHLIDCSLYYDKLDPSDYYIYKIKRL